MNTNSLPKTQKEVTTAAMRKLLELTRKYPLAVDDAVDACADKLLLDLAQNEIELALTAMNERNAYLCNHGHIR